MKYFAPSIEERKQFLDSNLSTVNHHGVPMTQAVSEGVHSCEAINYIVEKISAFPGFGSPIETEAEQDRWSAGWDGVEHLRNLLLNGTELTREQRLALFNCRKRWEREDEEKNFAMELITLSKVPLEERLCRRDEMQRLLDRQHEKEWLERVQGKPLRPKRLRRARLDWTDVKDLKEAHAARGDEARRQSRRAQKYSRESDSG